MQPLKIIFATQGILGYELYKSLTYLDMDLGTANSCFPETT